MARPREATLRSFLHGELEIAHPTWVIADDGETVALWEPAGSVAMRAVAERGGPRERNVLVGGFTGDHVEFPWTGQGVVRVHRRGEPWSTWRWWDAADGWSPQRYVNLEEPWAATDIGFDTGDWILDLVVDGEGEVRFKDEDELAWAERTGTFPVELASRVRSAAASALAAIGSGEGAFAADWSAWRPPDGMPLPALHPGWRRRPGGRP